VPRKDSIWKQSAQISLTAEAGTWAPSFQRTLFRLKHKAGQDISRFGTYPETNNI